MLSGELSFTQTDLVCQDAAYSVFSFTDTVSIKKLMVALVLVVVDPSPVFHSAKSSSGE